MRKTIYLIILLVIPFIGKSQEKEAPDFAYLLILKLWDSKTNKWTEHDETKLDHLPIFYTKGKVSIKDKSHSTYYIVGNAVQSTKDGVHIEKFNAFDDDGNNCEVNMVYNTESAMLAIKYDKQFELLYFLEPRK